MRSILDIFDLHAMLHLWLAGIRTELDSSIALFNLCDSRAKKYVYSNAYNLVCALTVISKQICTSRMTDKMNVQLSEGEGIACMSLSFRSEVNVSEYGEISMPDFSAALEFNREAIEYCTQMAQASNFEIKFYRDGNLFYFDFIFGKPQRAPSRHSLHSGLDFSIHELIIKSLSRF